MGTGHDPTTLLPESYGTADAARDRRDLATLQDPQTGWRTRRRLRHRVGDEDELAARLVAWEQRQAAVPRQRTAAEALQVQREEVTALAHEYYEVTAQLYGRHDADVLANTARIERGEVLPWEARRVITEERDRLTRLTRRGREVALAADAVRTSRRADAGER